MVPETGATGSPLPQPAHNSKPIAKKLETIANSRATKSNCMAGILDGRHF
jgi:hypothetical protein